MRYTGKEQDIICQGRKEGRKERGKEGKKVPVNILAPNMGRV